MPYNNKRKIIKITTIFLAFTLIFAWRGIETKASDTESEILPEKSLIAQWLPNAVRITFDSNDGGVAPAAQVYTYDIERSLPGQCLMAKAGYRFIGWAESSTATTPKWAPGESNKYGFGYVNSETAVDKTLYAVWYPINGMYIPITYEGDGSTAAYISAVTTSGWSSVYGNLTYADSTYSDAVIGIYREQNDGIFIPVSFDSDGATIAYVKSLTTAGYTPVYGTVTYADSTYENVIIGIYKAGTTGRLIPVTYNCDGSTIVYTGNITTSGWTPITGTVAYGSNTFENTIIGLYQAN